MHVTQLIIRELAIKYYVYWFHRHYRQLLFQKSATMVNFDSHNFSIAKFPHQAFSYMRFSLPWLNFIENQELVY